jgi:hypothetical protein
MSEFVPLRIAKKLKEKGFKEECVAHYHSNDPTCLIKNTALADYVQQPFCIESIKRSWNRCELNPCSFGCYYDAPTISQVMKWLRDTHNIHINVGFVRFNGNTELYWVFSVENIKDDVEYDWLYSTSHDSYEEAAMAGIEYVLDNLI